MATPRCSRCGRELPQAASSGSSPNAPLCTGCRGFDNAARNTFGLLKPEAMPFRNGWRAARALDGEFMGWLCSHIHAKQQEAEDCPDLESVLGAD